MNATRIYLLGFMGSGKSHIGKRLAQELNYSFVDLDDYIVEQSPYSSIAEIFEQQGEAYFRQLEQQALVDSQAWEQLVIATGGGSPCKANNIQLIKAAGFSVFLDPPLPTLAKRLWPERAQRPLIAKLKKKELENVIAKLLKKRRMYYEQADLQLRLATAEAIINKILLEIIT